MRYWGPPLSQEWVETERACYLIRQHVYASLSHRLGTRPFLSHLEKVYKPCRSHVRTLQRPALCLLQGGFETSDCRI